MMAPTCDGPVFVRDAARDGVVFAIFRIACACDEQAPLAVCAICCPFLEDADLGEKVIPE
jgi:hypothetical protein